MKCRSCRFSPYSAGYRRNHRYKRAENVSPCINPTNPRLNLVNSITSMCGAFTGIALIDFVGRRRLMLFGSSACMINMAIVAGLLAKTTDVSQARLNAGIAFICERLW